MVQSPLTLVRKINRRADDIMELLDLRPIMPSVCTSIQTQYVQLDVYLALIDEKLHAILYDIETSTDYMDDGMDASPDSTVRYQADDLGYTVEVSEGGRVSIRYQASNNPRDSQGPSLTKGGIPVRTLRKWARETAHDLLSLHGAVSVHEASDLRPPL